jgi:hypothetical protein
MNKRQIISSLNNIANTLDYSGMHREANSLTKVMTKLAASIYDTDQFWIIRGIIRPVTSHEAQTDTIINDQYRNDVLRVLQQDFFLPLKDCMPDEQYNDIFSDMSDFFRRENYDLEETLEFIYDKYSEAHVSEEDDMSKDEYLEATMPKILNMREPFFNAMRNPIDHALNELGWIRVNGNNIEVAKRLDDYTKSTIRRAMDEIFGDKATRMNFNIESLSGYKTLTYDELY